jgi:hypothetical protein
MLKVKVYSLVITRLISVQDKSPGPYIWLIFDSLIKMFRVCDAQARYI